MPGKKGKAKGNFDDFINRRKKRFLPVRRSHLASSYEHAGTFDPGNPETAGPLLRELWHYLKFLEQQQEEDEWADLRPTREVEQEVLDMIDG